MALTLKLDDIKPLLGAVGLGQDPTPAPKPVNAIPPPPMQMPPTPAAAGFSEWAGDPQNAKKVTDGITQPGTPLLPPAPPMGANMPPPPQMASANPPPGKDMSFLAPPSPSMPGPPPSMGASTPNFSTQTKMDADIANNPDAYQKPMLKKAGLVGNLLNFGTAGLLGAAGGLHGDPGAGANWVAQQAAIDRGVPAANAAEYDLRNVKPLRDAQALEQGAATLEHTKATTANLPMQMQLKRNEEIRKAAAKGQILSYDDDGIASVSDDPNSQAFKSQQALAEMHSATADKDAITSEIAKNHYVPGTPQYNEAQRKLAQVDKRLGVAMAGLGLRAQGLELRKQNTQAALYGTDLNNNALPGTTQITDDDGNISNVGSKNAGHAIAQQKTVGSFNDLVGSVGNVRKALKAYESVGGDMSDARLAQAASDPTSTIGKVINGKMVTGGLSPTAITLLNAVRQTHEQAGILRSTTGGTASEAGAQRILDTVPTFGNDTNASAYSKLDEQEKVLSRLAPGQTKVAGGLSVKKGGGITPPPTGGAPTEGQTKVNSHGDKVKFSGGKWGPA